MKTSTKIAFKGIVSALLVKTTSELYENQNPILGLAVGAVAAAVVIDTVDDVIDLVSKEL
jgi:hypothetical protein|nr:MAG TPA: hypothetical protein [Caudoviricetes sp.]